MHEKQPKEESSRTFLSVLRDERGGSFIEKMIIIGLFAIIVGAVVQNIGKTATDKMKAQDTALKDNVNDAWGGEGGDDEGGGDE